MFNKLYTAILDSSVWLESDPTRIVWVTFLASMDEDGFCRYAAVENVAHRARVSLAAAKRAIEVLEAPDQNSSNPENEGRRIERVPGGWMVLNSKHYRGLITREIQREQTRIRVANHRAKKKAVTQCNKSERYRNDVPASVTVLNSEASEGSKRFAKPSLVDIKNHGLEIKLSPGECDRFFDYYESNGWKVGRNPMKKWKSALVNWKRRVEETCGGNGSASRSTLLRELEVVEKERNALTPDGLNSMTNEEADRFRTLTKRRKEIRVALGLERA